MKCTLLMKYTLHKAISLIFYTIYYLMWQRDRHKTCGNQASSNAIVIKHVATCYYFVQITRSS